MDMQRLRQLAGLEPLKEELDVYSNWSLKRLQQHMIELKQELKDAIAAADGDDEDEIVDQIEQDIFDLQTLINKKKQNIK